MGVGTIVVAEDDADLRDLVEYTLESAGYDVEAFGAGDACWDRLEGGEPPALVVLDIGLPGMGGADVLERIRADAGLESLPVVLLSGRSRESDVVTELDVEADDYVKKPFSPEELRSRIGQLLGS